MRFRPLAYVLAVTAILTAGCAGAGNVSPSLSNGTLQQALGLTKHSATPAPISMKHVFTWDKIDGSVNTLKITPQQAAPWLDYALTIPSTGAAVKAAGIKSALYMNPSRQGPGGDMYTNDETEFAHDCSGNRIYEYHPNSTYNYTDPHSTTLQSLWVKVLAQELQWGGVADYVFEDNADQPVPGNMTATPCNFSWTDWTAATNALNLTVGKPVIGNSLGYTLPKSTQPGPGIGINPTTSGNMSEDCYIGRTPTGYFYSYRWQALENTEIQMASANKLFICHADWMGDAAASYAQRMYFYASVLLTYNQATQIVDTEFATPSSLHVMPEAQLVVTNPIVQSPTDISGLLQSSGVYGREYGACFLAGNYVGPCAIVVNSANPQAGPAKAFPWSATYHHTLTLQGEGVYDGGTVSVNGPQPPTTMPGGTSVIAFQ
jgi:hypothetical protein